MNESEQYVNEVLKNIQASPDERQRIAADLRAHLQEAVHAGEPVQEVLTRMGNPVEVAAAFMSQKDFQYASFSRRLGAFAVDMLIVILGAFMAAVVAVSLSNLVPRNPTGLGYVLGFVLILIIMGAVLLAIGLMLLYFPILEGRFGQTPGKRWVGLRVLKENGLPIGYREAFLRRLSFYFEFLPVDALFILFTERRQRALDVVARTIVVEEGAIPGFITSRSS